MNGPSEHTDPTSAADPHPSTEEIGKAEEPNTPRVHKNRHQNEIEEEQRVNNSVHDGEKYLKR